jgi:hypothetical protein
VRLEGIQQDKEAVLCQRVCEGGTLCLAKFQARGWSDGSGRECRLDARQVFDVLSAPRACAREGKRNGTKCMACMGRLKGGYGKLVAKWFG